MIYIIIIIFIFIDNIVIYYIHLYSIYLFAHIQ